MSTENSAAALIESLSDEQIKSLSKEDREYLFSQAEMELSGGDDVPTVESPADQIAAREAKPLGPIGTAAASAADTFLLNYGPQVYGASKAGAPIDRFGLIQNEDAVQSYTEARDEADAILKASREANPTPSMVGTGVGILGQLLTPTPIGKLPVLRQVGQLGAKVLEAATELLPGALAPTITRYGARVGSNVGKAGAVSFAQNPGDFPGIVDPIQIEERTANLAQTLTDPVTLGLSAVGGAFPKPSGVKAPEVFSEPQRKAISVLEPTPTQAQDLVLRARNIQDPQGPEAISNFLRKNRIGKISDDYEQIYAKANNVKRKLGQEIGEIYSKNSGRINEEVRKFGQKINDPNWVQKNPSVAQALTRFSSEDYYDDLVRRFSQDESIAFTKGKPRAVKYLSDYLDEVIKPEFTKFNPRLGVSTLERPSLKRLHDMRIKVDEAIDQFTESKRAGTFTGEMAADDAALNFFRKEINEAIMGELDVLESILGKKIGSRLRDLNKEFTTASKVTSLALPSLGRDLSKDARMSSVLSPLANIVEPTKGTSEAISNVGQAIFGGAGSLAAMAARNATVARELSQRNQGFEAANYIKVLPEEVAEYEKIINDSENLGVTEKAKKIKLLKKYQLIDGSVNF